MTFIKNAIITFNGNWCRELNEDDLLYKYYKLLEDGEKCFYIGLQDLQEFVDNNDLTNKIIITTGWKDDLGVYFDNYDNFVVHNENNRERIYARIPIESMTKLRRWYSHNIDIKIGDITRPLLYGICNYDEYLLLTRRKQCDDFEKKHLLYLNWLNDTPERSDAANTLRECGFCYIKKYTAETTPNLTAWEMNTEFFTDVVESKYCLAPAGQGMDSFRFYESLLLYTIPIVKRRPFFKYFENDFPVLLVDKWQDIDENLLISNYDRLYKRFENPIVKKRLMLFSYLQVIKDDINGIK